VYRDSVDICSPYDTAANVPERDVRMAFLSFANLIKIARAEREKERERERLTDREKEKERERESERDGEMHCKHIYLV
jgi:hypothetical protein